MTDYDSTKDGKETEYWRDVPGYEGLYQVSSMGNVKRIAAGRGTRAGRILKPQGSNGYKSIYLGNDEVGKVFYVHRLILLAFVGPPTGGRDRCNHINGRKDDNRLSNLEWVSQSENIQHSIHVLGNDPAQNGEASGMAKLTNVDVREIRRLLAAGLSQRTIGTMFEVSHRAIGDIATGKTWSHLE